MIMFHSRKYTHITGGLSNSELSNHEFVTPHKQISNRDDIANKWIKSEAYRDLLGFLLIANEAVKGKKITDNYPSSPTVEAIVQLLETLDGWITEIPPIQQPHRFGNKAFAQWLQKLTTSSETLLCHALDTKFHRAVPEIVAYLNDSFGNGIRIDYGTGHEMAFVTFLCCLFKIGAFLHSDLAAIVLKVFFRYIQLMQRLQTTYCMEPAGSHGVWSLDDYQFINFYWGSAQLIDHPRLKPKAFPDPEICTSFAKDYMFLHSIKYIHTVKTGPFAEHSNQLWNISGVPLWSKVNTGLLKMYKNEVLSKFPVIQHYLLGSLMSIKPADST